MELVLLFPARDSSNVRSAQTDSNGTLAVSFVDTYEDNTFRLVLFCGPASSWRELVDISLTRF